MEITSRKDKAKTVLESILNDIGNPVVSTMSLLYHCQKVARLLEIDEKDTLWIGLELEGYPSQDVNSQMESTGYRVPYYRVKTLPTTVTTPVESPYQLDLQFQELPMTAPFYITSPCGELETAKKSIVIAFNMLFDNPKGRWDYSSRSAKKIPARFIAKLSPDSMRGIVYAIRGRVNRFATAHSVALSFEDSMSNMVDATRNLLADRLQRLHPPLLDFIDETVKKQEISSDSVQWRDVLENTRTILRRLTGLFLKDSMIPDNESRPEEGETNIKTRMILSWLRINLGENHDREFDNIDANLDAIQKQQSNLMGLINKLGHGEVGDVTKGEVDRVLLHTIIWIADIIHLLDQTEFNWDDSSDSKS